MLTLVDVEDGRDRGCGGTGVAHRRELDDEHTVGDVLPQLAGDAHCEPGLADAAGAGERDQALAPDEAHDRVEVVLAADEARALTRCHADRPPFHTRRKARELERRVLVEDAPFELPERRRRLESRFVAQLGAHRLGAAERVRRTPGPVQTDHQLRPQPLAQRVRHDEGLRARDRGRCVTGREQRVDEILLGAQAQLVEPDGLTARPLVVRELGERRTVPQVERGLERRHRHRARGLAGAWIASAQIANGRITAAAADATSRSNSSASTRSGATSSM